MLNRTPLSLRYEKLNSFQKLFNIHLSHYAICKAVGPPPPAPGHKGIRKFINMGMIVHSLYPTLTLYVPRDGGRFSRPDTNSQFP